MYVCRERAEVVEVTDLGLVVEYDGGSSQTIPRALHRDAREGEQVVVVRDGDGWGSRILRVE